MASWTSTPTSRAGTSCGSMPTATCGRGPAANRSRLRREWWAPPGRWLDTLARMAVFTRAPARTTLQRLPRLVFGLVLCGTGIALMINANLGLAPWDVLHQGISKHTGVPIGTVGIFVGFA